MAANLMATLQKWIQHAAGLTPQHAVTQAHCHALAMHEVHERSRPSNIIALNAATPWSVTYAAGAPGVFTATLPIGWRWGHVDIDPADTPNWVVNQFSVDALNINSGPIPFGMSSFLQELAHHERLAAYVDRETKIPLTMVLTMTSLIADNIFRGMNVVGQDKRQVCILETSTDPHPEFNHEFFRRVPFLRTVLGSMSGGNNISPAQLAAMQGVHPQLTA
jgi:hypothetical protein